MSSWERQFSFTMPFSIQMYKWEPVIIILGRRAITNLSSGRYETLSTISHLQQAYSVVLRIIAFYYGDRSKPAILQLGCQKKFKFVSTPRKLKYCISQVIKAVVFQGKSTPSLSNLWYTVHWFSLVTTMELCWRKKQLRDSERESVLVKTFSGNLVRHSATWRGKHPQFIIRRPFAQGTEY